jgi:hypothetical protein
VLVIIQQALQRLIPADGGVGGGKVSVSSPAIDSPRQCERSLRAAAAIVSPGVRI